MALKTYSPDANRIVHNTQVDFSSRSSIFAPVHLVQYDDRLPILAVKLYNGGAEYAAPSSADANLRLSKRGHKFVTAKSLGCSEDRKTIYFEIGLQMMVDYGKTWPIIELVIGDQVAGSSPILFIIDKNPIQEGDIESTDEFMDLKGYIQEARDSAASAKTSEDAAAKSASAAKQSETNANNSKSEAATSASEAKKSETNAKNSETAAKESASAALASQTAAKQSETNANTSKIDAQYYYEQAAAVANSLTSALKPKGNIKFAALIALESPAPGDFYNVTDAFTSNASFVDGANIQYPAGSDVYYTSDSKWNVVQGPSVTGIKGSAESTYRKGQVEITKGNIGLDQVDNTPDSKKNVASAGKVTSKLTVGTKTYDGSAAVEVEKADIVEVLGYEPPVNDTQGVNLIAREMFLLNLSDNMTTGILDSDVPSGKCTSFITRANTNASGIYMPDNIYTEPIDLSTQYILSFYMKSNKNTVMSVYMGNTNNRITVETTWKKYEIRNTFSGSNKTISFYSSGTESEQATIYLSSVKLEKSDAINSFYIIPYSDRLFDALDPIPEAHRNLFRGKNLGTVFTDAQKAAIKAGTFHDLWVGDYWVINSHTWRIVDINYWYNKGDTSCTTNHIVVMPDATLYTHNMNATNTTEKGYQGSLMYTEGLTQAKTIVNTDFGEGFALSHRILLTNAVTDGHASGGGWVTSTVELANEIMMYGCHVFAALGNGTFVPYAYTTEYTQLALFRLVPRFINASRQWFWLRDVVSAANFAYVGGDGATSCNNASGVGGVRPVVGITGGN